MKQFFTSLFFFNIALKDLVYLINLFFHTLLAFKNGKVFLAIELKISLKS